MFAGETVLKRIHNLRTYFFKEVQKEGKIRSGSGTAEVYASKWAYFNSLQFLRPTTAKRETVSSLSVDESIEATVSEIYILDMYVGHR